MYEIVNAVTTYIVMFFLLLPFVCKQVMTAWTIIRPPNPNPAEFYLDAENQIVVKPASRGVGR